MLVPLLSLDVAYMAPLVCWLCLEVAFWIYIRWYLSPLLNARRVPPQSHRGPREHLEVIFRHIEMMRDYYPMDRFVSGWLGGARIEDVRQDNIKVVFAWVLYSLHLEELSTPQLQLVEEAVSPR